MANIDQLILFENGSLTNLVIEYGTRFQNDQTFRIVYFDFRNISNNLHEQPIFRLILFLAVERTYKYYDHLKTKCRIQSICSSLIRKI